MRSIQFMVEHQDKPLQVPRLAAVASMSPSHYFAVFKVITGFTPMDFLIRLRIQQACRLLDSVGVPVKQVAAALGYQDPFYFSRVFRAVNGMAPTQYRTLDSARRRRITAAALPVYTNCTDLFKELEESIQTICVST
jgi:AraC-like DNA-binding protein